MFLSQKPAFYTRDTFPELFLLWALPTLPSCSPGSDAPPPHPQIIGWGPVFLCCLLCREGRLCVVFWKGWAAVMWVLCLRGSEDPRPVLHSEPLKSLFGLGCSSARRRDSPTLLIVLICFSKGRMLVPRKKVGVEGDSIICGLKTKDNEPTV